MECKRRPACFFLGIRVLRLLVAVDDVERDEARSLQAVSIVCKPSYDVRHVRHLRAECWLVARLDLPRRAAGVNM